MLDFLFTKTPLKFFIESLWRDEAYSYLLAKRPIFEMMSLTARDFNPPLYYFILHFWTLLFGHSEIALRSLSLVFFCGLLFIMHLLMAEIFKFSQFRSYRYLLIFVISPVLLYYAFEARMYVMLAFFASFSSYAFLRKDTKLYYVATILGLYTHYFMVLIVLTQGVYILLNERRKVLLDSLRMLILPGIIFIPWGIYVLAVKTGLSESFWILPPPYKDFWHIPGIIFTGYERGFNFFKVNNIAWLPLILELSAVIVIICGLGYYALYRKRNIKSLHIMQYLLLWSFLPPILIFISSYFFKPLFLPRYLILSVPGMILALVYSLSQLKLYPRIILVLFLIVLTTRYQILQIDLRKRDDFSKMFRQINSLAKKDDVVYVTDVLSYFVAEYYFDENKVYVYGLEYGDIPSYVGKVLIPPDRVTFQLPTFPKRAFVVQDYHTYSLQSNY